jgi:ppGpp synthetase/RelA/SpoT-type nucleotidyltranferase
VGKIARKNYKTPLTQMTDLVGVRFVVLISPQIEPIKGIIESCPAWTATLDQDSNEEINETPESFHIINSILSGATKTW